MLISVISLLFNAVLIGGILIGIIVSSQYIIDGLYWVKDETIIMIDRTRNILYSIGDGIVNLDDRVVRVIKNLDSIDISKFKDIC